MTRKAIEELIKPANEMAFPRRRLGNSSEKSTHITGPIDTAKLAAEKDVCLHTHLAETEDENAFCQEMFGCRPLDYLEQVGWLNDRVWLAHGIHFSPSEIKRLGEANIGVSHCPSSNMILGSGICPIMDLETAQVPVGLGVDGSASADSSNLMQEVRQALLIQRLTSPPEAITPERALHWGTLGGAKLIHRDDIGQIAPGYEADDVLGTLANRGANEGWRVRKIGRAHV